MSILISVYFVVTLPMTTNIGCIAFKNLLLLFVNWAILPFLFLVFLSIHCIITATYNIPN